MHILNTLYFNFYHSQTLFVKKNYSFRENNQNSYIAPENKLKKKKERKTILKKKEQQYRKLRNFLEYLTADNTCINVYKTCHHRDNSSTLELTRQLENRFSFNRFSFPCSVKNVKTLDGMNEREVTVYTAARYTSLLHYRVVSGECSTKWRDTDSHFLFINYLSRKGRRQCLSSNVCERPRGHMTHSRERRERVQFHRVISIPSSRKQPP